MRLFATDVVLKPEWAPGAPGQLVKTQIADGHP